MKRILGTFTSIMFTGILLFGCGGGGGGGSSDSVPRDPLVTVPSENIDGTYAMRGFLLKYSNGTTITETSPTICDFSGSMVIASPLWTQRVSLNGLSGGGTATVSITWTNTDHTAGIANVSYPGGGRDTFEVSIDGYRLTVYAYAADSLGNTVEEWDYWEKVLDTADPVGEETRSVVVNDSTADFAASAVRNLLNR